jgi:hypothetical protein
MVGVDMTHTSMPSDDGVQNVANINAAVRPEWIRLPKEGKSCPYSGLSRSYLSNLLRSQAVKSNVLRNPGAIRGVRLISYDSLMAYIRSTGEPGPKK